ncbi:MAG: hypothetical protein DWQ18_06270 [Crenarchaeota archaeon]|nr:MAG: hypothetical protein DWQ17_03515 [Thermoproteota archaeon]RDJ33407.1 MAG: hypothetical protein DWQ18_06270 [Thermoproteota archaeon]RDJ38039.1 MAG: hypothetical protein DWQ13_04900 [Thermoproteota archaeon]RDJ38396.1 MAG: hypothetical protein DWQ19_00905 [Thermoproteota archaeon]
MDLSESQKHGLIFGGAIIIAGLVLATVVFPFWNLIREDVFEEVEILSNKDGVCYVATQDNVPKTIENCNAQVGDSVTIKFGRDLAWAEIVTP